MKNETYNLYQVTIEQWSEAYGARVQTFFDVVASDAGAALLEAEHQNRGANAITVSVKSLNLPLAEVRMYQNDHCKGAEK